jgi:type III restriction enzyme
VIRPKLDPGLVAAVAAALDLRAPNRDALMTIALRVSEHFAAEEPFLPYEGVIDVATGVGKTYVLAGVIEYLAEQGYRDFAIITPGRTVARKTVRNFTPGNAKSLLPGMEVDPVVVTSETFSSPAVATAMADPERVKVYIFTVQALLKPTTKMGRKTREFDEDLGDSFYERLRSSNSLVVMADEYHLYGGLEFSKAMRGLDPQILLGLTATPPKGSPVIFRYPLAAAIAEHYVKTPAIVGRRDDRADAITKLQDGVRLLDAKKVAIDQYRATHPDAAVINPVMLVVCASKDDADEVEEILQHRRFENGRFADAVLKVYSDAPDLDAQLGVLDDVEDPDSDVRVIVAVGMLKEGWDVKNVYVIASLRASVSQILTEQTLGRGLRLPFGHYTGVELLDTLEVVAHERYEALIKQIDKLRESFIDFRTKVEAPPAPGTIGAAATDEPVDLPFTDAGEKGAAEGGLAPIVTDIDSRMSHVQDELAAAGNPLHPRTDVATIELPVVSGDIITNPFSLNDVTDLAPYRAEGRRIAATPADRLRRVIVGGKITETEGGDREARLEGRTGTVELASPVVRRPLAESIAAIVDGVMATGIVPARKGEPTRLRQLVDALVEGVGPDAENVLSAYPERAAAGIVARVKEAQRAFVPKPDFRGEVKLEPFTKVREGRATVFGDRFGPFARGVGYAGFAKSLYGQDWFDSGSAERDLANVIDDAPDVAVWLRLQRGDLPLPWRGPNEAYHPDFVVVETGGTHYVIEGKRDTDADREDVAQKREAAARWANHVTTATGTSWRYLFVLETDIKAAKGLWGALKRLASERQ